MVWFLDPNNEKPSDEEADNEVSKIVAWALEDERVTIDDSSFEGIEVVSSHDEGRDDEEEVEDELNDVEIQGMQVVKESNDPLVVEATSNDREDDHDDKEDKDASSAVTSPSSSVGGHNEKIDTLKAVLRSIEAKYEMSMAATHELWESRFEKVQEQLEVQSQELKETKESLKEAQSHIQAQATQLVTNEDQQEALSKRVTDLEEKSVQEIQEPPTPPPTNNALWSPSSNKSEISWNSTDGSAGVSTKTTQNQMSPSSLSQGTTFEALLQKQVEAQLDQLFAERDEEFDELHQQIKEQGKQLKKIADVQQEQSKLHKLFDSNFEILVARENQQAKSICTLEKANVLIQDGYETVLTEIKGQLFTSSKREPSGGAPPPPSSSENEPEESSLEDNLAARRASIAGLSSDSTDPTSNIAKSLGGGGGSHVRGNSSSSSSDEETSPMLHEAIKKECREMIERENERMMRTWGTHFQDLATLVQNDLDNQRESIAEARTSTFEHMDAETRARTTVWNTQYNQLLTQLRQHAQAIDNVKDDQERSMMIVVDTMVNLKLQVQELSDEIKEEQSPLLLDNYNVSYSKKNVDTKRVLHMIDQKAKEWKLEMVKYAEEVQSLKAEYKKLAQASSEIMEDHNTVQNVLETTIDLFNAKMETNADIFTIQLNDLQRELMEEAWESFATKKDHETMQQELDKITKRCESTFVEVVEVLEMQAAELKAAQEQQGKPVRVSKKNVSFTREGEDAPATTTTKKPEVETAKEKASVEPVSPKPKPQVRLENEREVEYFDLTPYGESKPDPQSE